MARLPVDPEAFIRANTALERPAIVPEFRLWLASEYVPIWQATEDWLEQQNVDPPYWAFCWPGGQAIARYLLDQGLADGPELALATRAGLRLVRAEPGGEFTVEVELVTGTLVTRGGQIVHPAVRTALEA